MPVFADSPFARQETQHCFISSASIFTYRLIMSVLYTKKVGPPAFNSVAPP